MEETGNSMAGTSSGDDANRRRMRPGVVATLVMIAMFAFGALAGVALDRHLVHARGGGRDRGEGPRFVPGMSMPSNPRSSAAGRDSMRPRGGGEFAKALGLSAAQAAAVDSVMAQDFKAVSALREEMRPRIEAIIASTRQRIDSLLTPQQREKYHALIAEQQQRMQRRERGGPRRGGGGGPPF
jgi:Spy/CpxP family protein refolding chaperone